MDRVGRTSGPGSLQPTINPLATASGRIIGGFSLLVIILVAVAAGSAWQVQKHRSDTAAMEEHAATTFLLLDAQANTEAAAAALQRYVIVGDEAQVTGDETLIPQIQTYVATAVGDLTEVIGRESVRGDEDHAAAINEVFADGVALAETVGQIVVLRQSGDVEGATAALEQTVSPFREFERKLNEAADRERGKASALRDQADRAGTLALWLLLTSAGAGAILGFVASAFIARSIIKPLSSLEATAVAVANGDLQARAQATGPRELARLSASLNSMTESLLDASKRQELEDALRESERCLLESQSVAQIGSYVLDIPSGVWESSPALDRIFGIDEDYDRSVEGWLALVHPDVRQSMADYFAHDVVEEHGRFDIEYRVVRHDDGIERWVLGLGKLEFDARGRPLIMIGTIQDITERKKAEEALRESEEKLRSVIENVTDLVTTITPDGKFIFVNRTVPGLSEADVIGASVYDYTLSEDHDTVRTALADAIKTGQPGGYQSRGVGPNGVTSWYDCRVGPIKHDGEVVALTLVATDITDRKKAEKALRKSETKFRTMAETVAAATFIYQGTRIRYMNSAAEALTGYTQEEMMSMTFWDVIHPDHRDLVRERGMSRQRGGQVPIRYEVKIQTKDGDVRWVDFTAGTIEFEGKPSVLGTAFDITERKRAEEALRFTQFSIDRAADPAFWTTSDARFVYVNDAACRSLGYTSDELLSLTVFDICPSISLEAWPGLWKELKEGGSATLESEYRAKNGRTFPVEIASNYLEFDGKEYNCAFARDITERKRAEETIRHQAYHDALTGLPNRTLFQDRLNVALAQARRKRQMAAVMFLDLDRFKVVNDTVGHALGDQLLKRVAERLSSHLREGDTVARVGGDEFTLLIPDVARTEDVVDVANRIMESLREPWLLNGHEFHVTGSIGIAMCPDDGEDGESLLRNADTAMYRAKDQGRDNYKLYTSTMNARIAEKVALESSLHRALERKEFVLYYQPQVNIGSGEIVGVEALVRWQHPQRGLVLPAEFIPVAEETGLIVPLGEWVLRTACEQSKAWQQAGHPSMRMAVNISARQFQLRKLINTVANALSDANLDPRWLQLEITEGVAMQDAEFTITTLRELKTMGVQIAIDDFGTGHSSLSYLKRFPIDVVKIDQSFVCDLTLDPNDAAIASTIIAMAHNLKLNVIAEGVETEEQLAFLKRRECNEMQGFLFSKPLPATEVEKVLPTRRRRTKARLASEPS